MPMRVCVQETVAGSGSTVADPCPSLSESMRGSGRSIVCSERCHPDIFCVQGLDSAAEEDDSPADGRW